MLLKQEGRLCFYVLPVLGEYASSWENTSHTYALMIEDEDNHKLLTELHRGSRAYCDVKWKKHINNEDCTCALYQD